MLRNGFPMPRLVELFFTADAAGRITGATTGNGSFVAGLDTAAKGLYQAATRADTSNLRAMMNAAVNQDGLFRKWWTMYCYNHVPGDMAARWWFTGYMSGEVLNNNMLSPDILTQMNEPAEPFAEYARRMEVLEQER